MRLFGIDGCKAGWVVSEVGEDLSGLRFSVVRTAFELFARIGPDDFAVIDIPFAAMATSPFTFTF